MEKNLRGILPEGMLTDNFSIDTEHEEIFSRIQRLQREDLETEDRFFGQMTDLLTCLADHFATEEQLAADAGVVFFVHGQNHAQNLRLFTKAIDEVKGGRMEPRIFLRYIDYWFEQHISEFDKPFVRQLQTRADSARKAEDGGADQLSV